MQIRVIRQSDKSEFRPLNMDIRANPRNKAAEMALAIYHAALEAVRADRLIERALARDGDCLRIGDERLNLADFEHVYVVGAGKASAAMAAAIEPILGDRLTEGVVVTKYGHSRETSRIRILEADHPVPDDNSLAAGRAIYELVSRGGPNDLVICLLSGGASALMEMLRKGITLEDLQRTTNLLLRAGANIHELNMVRIALSQLKAGGLARAALPARLICLVISDVLGNPPEVIGSGPCVPTDADHTAARLILTCRQLWKEAPKSVKSVLVRAPESIPVSALPLHVIIGDIWSAIDAARIRANQLGLRTSVLTGWLSGEAREIGGVFAGIARDFPRTQKETGIDCFVAGGETTVTVRGDGKGGRSQELASFAALSISGDKHIALLAAGTDGTDGPTDAAGGLVDGLTVRKATEAGVDVWRTLQSNNSYHLLVAADSLVYTGPTDSNVNDLVIAVYQPA